MKISSLPDRIASLYRGGGRGKENAIYDAGK